MNGEREREREREKREVEIEVLTQLMLTVVPRQDATKEAT